MLTPISPKSSSQEDAFTREQLLEALHLKETEGEKRLRKEKSWKQLMKKIQVHSG